MSLITVVRWIHVIAAAAWLGEVVAVVFILVPAALKLTGSDRSAFISRVFPRVFRLATVLAVTTLVAGASLNFLVTRWRDLDLYIGTQRGAAIVLGGLLGLLLASFHFIAEGRLEPKVQALMDAGDDGTLGRLSRFLTLVPRIGLVIILAIFLLMMIGARGL
jgi:uncharacterized membrane protein